MIFTTENVSIDLTELKNKYDQGFKKWGIKISGGADSALVAYMLIHIIQANDWDDVSIHAITGITDTKPWNEIYAKKVLKKLTEISGFEFSGHTCGIVSSDNYAKSQEKLVNHAFETGKVNLRFTGITANPDRTSETEHIWKYVGPADSNRRNKSGKKKPLFNSGNSCNPLINTDKRGVAELYEYFGITDDIFPLTRSCEKDDAVQTENFTRHCEKCWFCLEREWGFGRFE